MMLRPRVEQDGWLSDRGAPKRQLDFCMDEGEAQAAAVPSRPAHRTETFLMPPPSMPSSPVPSPQPVAETDAVRWAALQQLRAFSPDELTHALSDAIDKALVEGFAEFGSELRSRAGPRADDACDAMLRRLRDRAADRADRFKVLALDHLFRLPASARRVASSGGDENPVKDAISELAATSQEARSLQEESKHLAELLELARRSNAALDGGAADESDAALRPPLLGGPSVLARAIGEDLQSLNHARNALVSRGPASSSEAAHSPKRPRLLG